MISFLTLSSINISHFYFIQKYYFNIPYSKELFYSPFLPKMEGGEIILYNYNLTFPKIGRVYMVFIDTRY